MKKERRNMTPEEAKREYIRYNAEAAADREVFREMTKPDGTVTIRLRMREVEDLHFSYDLRRGLCVGRIKPGKFNHIIASDYQLGLAVQILNAVADACRAFRDERTQKAYKRIKAEYEEGLRV